MKSFYIKLFSILLIFCLGIIVYSNAFYCSFHLDDFNFIVNNFVLKHIDHLQDIWKYLPARFVFYLSLALNYYFNGLDVFGYHVVNLVIHLISACLVWWLTLLTLSTPAMKEAKIQGKNQGSVINRHANLIALLAGLIFVSHPIQTQGVTYIMQRAASMATMFYVLSLCLYVKSRLLCMEVDSRFRGNDKNNKVIPAKAGIQRYYIGAVITTVLAMFTKEISITLPLIVLLYEFSFLRTNKGLNWKPVIPFMIALFIIPVTMVFTHDQSVNSQEIKGALQGSTEISSISSTQYLLTQFRVMVTYIRLLVIPLNQNLDYDYPISNSLFELPTVFSFLFLLGILYAAKLLFSKYRLISFSIFWFFLTLLPESSIFAIKDVIFEHRLYLPMVGYSLFWVSGLYYFPQNNVFKTILIVLMMIIGCNSILTYQRNKVWLNEITLWNDTISKSPHKSRPYNNRGNVYNKQGNLPQALADYDKAIEIDPKFSDAYDNRGLIYDKEGKFTQALADYGKVIALNPNTSVCYYNRGLVYDEQENLPQALLDYNKAIELNPQYGEAYNNRANVYAAQGNLPAALSDYNKAIELDSNNAQAHYNRGNMYYKQGNVAQTLEDYSKAIEINPSFVQVYSNRAVIYYQLKKYDMSWADVHQLEELGASVNPALLKALKNISG